MLNSPLTSKRLFHDFGPGKVATNRGARIANEREVAANAGRIQIPRGHVLRRRDLDHGQPVSEVPGGPQCDKTLVESLENELKSPRRAEVAPAQCSGKRSLPPGNGAA